MKKTVAKKEGERRKEEIKEKKGRKERKTREKKIGKRNSWRIWAKKSSHLRGDK